nr:hypothetical protein [Candidatus Sigynarchaeum springense]
MSAELWRKYRTRRTRVIYHLGMAFSLIGIGFLTGTLPIFIVLTFGDVPILNGIPVGEGMYLWWTNFSFAFVILANLFLFKFLQGLFDSPSQKFFYLFAVANIFLAILDVYRGIFVVIPGVNALSVEMGMIFFFIELVLWGLIASKLFRSYRKIRPSIDRVSIITMAVGSVFMIVSLFMFALGNIIQGLVIDGLIYATLLLAFYWLLIILTVFFIYIGFIRPDWFKALIRKISPELS